jgi:hypothetical protein
MDVDVIPKSGAPAEVVDSAPPDGRYELVQASSYGVDGSAPLVATLRASLDVSGARLILGAQATRGTTLEANESFTLTVTPGVLTKVCESRHGAVAAGLLRGAPGATSPAHLGWNASTSLLTLVMTTSSGEIELLFTPP